MAGTRHNILKMPLQEVRKVTAALDVLKAEGVYDGFVERHVQAMNVAHRGPAFLPWHRAALSELEDALREVDPTIPGLPYWRWHSETAANGGDPRRSKFWTADYVGGDGDPAAGNRVLNGPFAHWHAVIVNNSTGGFTRRSTPGLVRRLGRDPGGSKTLPDDAQVRNAIERYPTYDVSPWNATVSSFRNRLEGWSGGPRMHNLVHRYVGGDMLTASSPNDPVFWLNHGNVDRLWWIWQGRRGINSYRPVTGGPAGHNLHDTMRWLRKPRTPASVLDLTDLGVTYVS